MATEDTVPISLALPPSLHPSMLKSGDGDAKSALTSVYETARKVKDTSRAISEHGRPPLKMRKMTEKDKAEQELWGREQRQQQYELLTKSRPLIEASSSKIDKAINTLGERAKSLDAEIVRAIVPRSQDGPMQTEIRQKIAARKEDAIKVMTAAINNGQREVVAAVLGAPAFLTEFTEEHHKELWALARKSLEPEKQARLELAQRDLRVLQSGREWFQKWATEFADKWSQPHASIISRGLE